MRSKFLLLGILILGLALRLINLNQSLWLDEAISVNGARNFSAIELLAKFSPGDFHPPLHYLLLKVWISVFGASEVSARSLSVLFGVATIWVVFLIGRRLFTREIGLIAAVFMATAPLHIYYSQEARMYVPVAFFTAVAVLFFLKLIGKNGDNLINWLGLILSGTVLLYTDYLPGFIFIFFIFYLLFFERGHLKKYNKKWFAAAATTAVLFLPWLPIFLQQFQAGLLVKTRSPEWWNVLGRTNLKEVFLVPIKFVIGRIPVDSSVFHVATLTVTAILFATLLFISFKKLRENCFLWLWLLIPVVGSAILGLRLSVFSYFRLIFVLPAFYLLLAAGALSFRSKKAQALAVLVVTGINFIATSLYLFNPRFHREDWRSAVRFIESNSQENAATLFVGEGQQEPYKYYAKTVPSFGPKGIEKGSFGTIFLMRYVQPILDPQDLLRQKVEESDYRKVGEHDFNGVVLWEYKRI